jgi:hypothetical protein
MLLKYGTSSAPVSMMMKREARGFGVSEAEERVEEEGEGGNQIVKNDATMLL